MKHLPLLLIAALGFAADDAPRPQGRPDQASGAPRPEGHANVRLPVPLSPDEQKRLREAMEKAHQDPAVKEAHEQAAKAQQKAREVTDEAARKADPSVAPILEKVRKAMEQRQPGQPGRQPEAQPRGEAPRQREGGNRQPDAQPGRGREEGNRQPEAQPRGEAPRQREGNREQPATRGAQLPGLTPDEQQRVREAMTKANAEPAVREAREATQRKAMEIAEDAARKADPSIGPLLEKMRQANENPRGRKPE